MKPREVIKELVKSNESLLKTFKTHSELFQFAAKNGLNETAQDFKAFVKSLLEIGIDYYDIKKQVLKERERFLEQKKEDLLKKINKKIVLYSSANFNEKRFAICNEIFDPVWFGKFFKDPKNEFEAHLESAKKAIYAASICKNKNDIEAVKLLLIVDLEWLEKNDTYKKVSIELSQKAIRDNIVLDLQTAYQANNPAKKYTFKPEEGQKSYMKLNVSYISLFKTQS